MALPAPLSMATNGPRTLGGLVQFAVRLEAVSATDTIPLHYAPDGDSVIASLSFVPDATLAADNSDYWAFQLQNKGTDGTGTTAMMTEVDTRAASLNGLTAFDAEDFTLTADSVNDGEVAAIVLTKNGSAADLAGTFILTVKRAVTY